MASGAWWGCCDKKVNHQNSESCSPSQAGFHYTICPLIYFCVLEVNEIQKRPFSRVAHHTDHVAVPTNCCLYRLFYHIWNLQRKQNFKSGKTRSWKLLYLVNNKLRLFSGLIPHYVWNKDFLNTDVKRKQGVEDHNNVLFSKKQMDKRSS